MKSIYHRMTMGCILAVLLLTLTQAGCKNESTPSPAPQDSNSSKQDVAVKNDIAGPGPEQLSQAIASFSQGSKDRAVKQFLDIDWQKKARFPQGSLFAMTEKEFISLTPAQQAKNRKTLGDLRKLTRHILDAGTKAAANNNNKQAKRYFQATQQCGNHLSNIPEGVALVRAFGTTLSKFASQQSDKLK